MALVSKDGESIAQLLERLDTALGKAMAEDTVIDARDQASTVRGGLGRIDLRRLA